MPLQGNLKEMSLANLIQVNCQEIRTARLTLTHLGQSAVVFISDGQVVHAESDLGQGEDVFYRTLAWQDGTFTLDTDVPSPARTIQTPWPALLLEGMKRATEFQAQAKNAANSLESKPNERLLQQLRKIEGVTGVVLASSDGVVLNSDISNSDGESEAAVAVFIGGAARQMSESLPLGKFQHGVVFTKNRHVLVLQTADRYCGLVVSEHGSPTIIAKAASGIFK